MNATHCFEQIIEAADHKTATARPLVSHRTNPPRKTKKTFLSTGVEVRMKLLATFSYGHVSTSVGRPAKTYNT